MNLQLGIRMALNQHSDALATGGTSCDDAELPVLADEAVGCVHGQANSGGSYNLIHEKLFSNYLIPSKQ